MEFTLILLYIFYLTLTPQSWGLQDWWYNLWHYKNGRFSHPFKLMLASILWLDFVILLVITFAEGIKAIRGKNVFASCYFLRLLLSCVSPFFNRINGAISSKSKKECVSSLVLGSGITTVLFHQKSK